MACRSIASRTTTPRTRSEPSHDEGDPPHAEEDEAPGEGPEAPDREHHTPGASASDALMPVLVERPCRACQEPLVFVTMRETNAAMPCETTLLSQWLDETAGRAASTMTLVTPEGLLLIGRPVAPETPGARLVTGYAPHWARCPQAKSFRR